MTCPECDGNGCRYCCIYDVVGGLEKGWFTDEQRKLLIEALKISPKMKVSEFQELSKGIQQQVTAVILPAIEFGSSCWAVGSQADADQVMGWVIKRLEEFDEPHTITKNLITLKMGGTIEFLIP